MKRFFLASVLVGAFGAAAAADPVALSKAELDGVTAGARASSGAGVRHVPGGFEAFSWANGDIAASSSQSGFVCAGHHCGSFGASQSSALSVGKNKKRGKRGKRRGWKRR